jgi:hypothetical protein
LVRRSSFLRPSNLCSRVLGKNFML